MTDNIVNHLKSGKIVCFPTETVYALAANALNAESVCNIYKMKNRDTTKRLSIFLSDINQINDYAITNELSEIIINQLMPGPITIILPLKQDIFPIKYFKDTIAIRIPNHPIALEILAKIDFPIVATSTNLSGQPSITKFVNIPKIIRENISSHIHNDDLVQGIESTIVDLTKNNIHVIREGSIPANRITDLYNSDEVQKIRKVPKIRNTTT